MKKSALFAMLMAGATLLSATDIYSAKNARCREMAKPLAGVKTEIWIAQDLQNATWEAPNESTYEFFPNGDMFLFSKNKKEAVPGAWDVEIQNGKPVLIMAEKNRIATTYYVEQTCEGLDLTDVVNHDAFSLHHRPLALPGKNLEMKKNLLGEWTNVTFFDSDKKCDHAAGGHFNYTFNKNGNYECNYGSQSHNNIEKGKWTISKDGQFLLLKTNTGEASIVKIANLDNHGMVLEQAMNTNKISDFFCSDLTAFVFIK